MKGGVNIDTKSLMYKLQKALKTKGIILCINTNQFYSTEQDRYITMYTVVRNKKQLIRTASQIQVINKLQEIWEEVKNND
uniref:Uncharacterized protein n=1 Tax=Siphoviridae sp. ctwDi18 TaxID=2827970 RepID=A0A8S5TAY0_9CAUD|nr:MAG TPA: hypothetical protein [Siphoviridae sp. ctwDi18]